MDLEQFRTPNGLALPESYIKFVTESGEPVTRLFNECPEEEPDFEGRPWEVKDIPGLSEIITVRGAGQQPFHACIQLFLKLHQEFTGLDFVESDTEPLETERVIGGFAFAEDNGDYLYLDPFDSFSVWIFNHDGANVEFAANDFETWLAISKPEE